jgi:hypothetical protein
MRVEVIVDRVVAWHRKLDLGNIIYIIWKGVNNDSFFD